MTLNHTIHALMVGLSESWWRAGIMPCVRSDVDRDKPVAYIFWLVDGPDGPVVVDTGYHPDYVAPEWAQGKDFIEPPALLKKVGVKAEEVKTVIVTHFHQDHFTGFDYFPAAKFVIQRAELEFWTGPLMRYGIFDKQIRPKVRPALKQLEQDKRLQLIDGDCELYPGLDLLKAGGHTPGSRWRQSKLLAARPCSAAISRTRSEIFATIIRWVGTIIWATRRQRSIARSRPPRGLISHCPITIRKLCEASVSRG